MNQYLEDLMRREEKNMMPLNGRRTMSKIWIRSLLTFSFQPLSGFSSEVVIPFRPIGIAIWNAPPKSTTEFFVGNMMVGISSIGAAPTKFFAMGDNFEQIKKLLDEGKEPPAWITWPVLDVNMRIRIRVFDQYNKLIGPDEGIELVMWGISIKEC